MTSHQDLEKGESNENGKGERSVEHECKDVTITLLHVRMQHQNTRLSCGMRDGKHAI